MTDDEIRALIVSARGILRENCVSDERCAEVMANAQVVTEQFELHELIGLCAVYFGMVLDQNFTGSDSEEDGDENTPRVARDVLVTFAHIVTILEMAAVSARMYVVGAPMHTVGKLH